MKKIKVIIFSILCVAIFSGCSTQQAYIQEGKKNYQAVAVGSQAIQRDKNHLASNETFLLVATGEGVAPLRAHSNAQAMTLARRAAIADAHRQMAEQLFGARIESKDVVSDATLQSSRIISQVYGIVRNAAIVENVYHNGLYIVRMEMEITKEAFGRASW